MELTACDTPLAELEAHALLAWGRAQGRGWQLSYFSITAHGLPPAFAQSAARHMTAGARRSLRVTRRWRGAGRMPCLHGAGFQAHGLPPA